MSADTDARLSAREAVMMGDAPDLPIIAELKRLRDENARLRELVQSMYDTLSHETFPPDWLKDYEADMRELGIEVKE